MGRSKFTGQQLFQALNMLHMSQQSFADVLGVEQATVSRWVTGKQPVPKYAVREIEREHPLLYSQITGSSDEARD